MSATTERKTSKLAVTANDKLLRIEGERGALNVLINVLFQALRNGSGAARSVDDEPFEIIVHRIDSSVAGKAERP